MIFKKLIKDMGISVVVRNIMVDYCDNKGNYFHKPLQSVTPVPYEETDTELITSIKEEMRQQNYTVCSITEVYGDFEIDDLESIFNGERYGEYPQRTLYLDAEKAMKG